MSADRGVRGLLLSGSALPVKTTLGFYSKKTVVMPAYEQTCKECQQANVPTRGNDEIEVVIQLQDFFWRIDRQSAFCALKM